MSTNINDNKKKEVRRLWKMSVRHKVIFFPLPQWSLSAQHCVHDHNSHYPLENNKRHHNNTIVMLTATTWWWRLENWRSGVLRQVGMKPWCRVWGRVGSVEIGVNDGDYYRWTNEVGLFTPLPPSCFLYPFPSHLTLDVDVTLSTM